MTGGGSYSLGLGAVLLGALFLWAAVKGENPLQITRDVLTGNR